MVGRLAWNVHRTAPVAASHARRSPSPDSEVDVTLVVEEPRGVDDLAGIDLPPQGAVGVERVVALVGGADVHGPVAGHDGRAEDPAAGRVVEVRPARRGRLDCPEPVLLRVPAELRPRAVLRERHRRSFRAGVGMGARVGVAGGVARAGRVGLRAGVHRAGGGSPGRATAGRRGERCEGERDACVRGAEREAACSGHRVDATTSRRRAPTLTAYASPSPPFHPCLFASSCRCFLSIFASLAAALKLPS